MSPLPGLKAKAPRDGSAAPVADAPGSANARARRTAVAAQPNAVGSVVALWRYPVKSMQGEELNAAEVTPRGLLGDRAFALVDPADGKVASAKNPRKWPDLFAFRAAYAEAPRGEPLPQVRITLPDGRTVSGGQPNRDEILSAAAGRA